MSRKVRYQVGRLNLIAPYPTGDYSAKADFLLRALNAANSIESYGFKYRFVGVAELPTRITNPERRFLLGHLLKYKREGEVKFFDDDTGTTKSEEVPNKLVASSEFVLEVRTGIMLFHPVSNKISTDQFRRFFAELIEDAELDESVLVDAQIQLVEEKYRFIEEIRSLDLVTRVTSSLHPSNPSYNDYWRELDDRIQDSDATSYEETYESEGESGLNVEEGSPTFASITMASDGYGESSVSGERDGEQVVIKSSKHPVEVKGQRLQVLRDKFEGVDDIQPVAFDELDEVDEEVKEAIWGLLEQLDQVFKRIED